MRKALLSMSLLLVASLANADAARSQSSLRAIERTSGEKLRKAVSATTGAATFIGSSGAGIAVAAAAGAPVKERAQAFLREHASSLGLPGADDLQIVSTSPADETGIEAIRLRQLHHGIPVRFAEVTMHLRGARLISTHARTLADVEEVSLAPTVTAEAATQAARQAIADAYGVSSPTLSAPTLELFNRGLLEHTRTSTRLAWFVAADGPLLKGWVWIDAQSGEVLFHVNQVPDALYRYAYDQQNTSNPPVFVGDEVSPPLAPQDAIEAFAYAGDTYNYFATNHGRDSYDNAGSPMTVVVRYCSAGCGCPCLNAFWFGTYAVFGAAPAPNAQDDIVGHEFTHGVTQYTAGLVYYAASGALNESYSDIFGETIDLTNGVGYDGPGTRWLIGESSAIPIGGRNMMNPSVPLGFDPPMMSSSAFYCGSGDNAGVHSNSAIGNHAYALMVDGGTFNGFTISGIGLVKAAKIEYRTLTQYLTPSSTYTDNYDALLQSCSDLIGVVGISAADCAEVQKALDAVEMYAPWPCTCGNGVLDAEEQCDDGNKIDGDCCSALCQTSNLGDPCSDGNGCTANDTCQMSGPSLTCVGNSGPRSDCRRSSGSNTAKLAITDSSLDNRDQLQFSYGKGDTTPAADFGDPTSTTDYTLCLYKDAFNSPMPPSLLKRLEIPSGETCNSRPCWKATGKGFKFTDTAATNEGVVTLALKEGTSAGRTKISLKARGSNLSPPLTSELNANLTAQIISSSGTCWSADFATPATKLSVGVYKDKGQ